MKREKKIFLLLTASALLLALSACSPGAPDSGFIDDRNQEEEETGMQPNLKSKPPIDLEVPENLETATFALG